MKSPTITMERVDAESRLAQYEDAMKANPKASRELDRGVMQGYRVLAKGGRLVDVNSAIGHAGLNRAGQPMLAIARAHVERVQWVPRGIWNSPGGYRDGAGDYLYTASLRASGRITDDRTRWALPANTFDVVTMKRMDVQAFAPLIPLPLRPRTKLENYFLLWEANWHPAPPVDPYLLKPLAGSLMEIVAEWDVTPLELAAVRASMQGTIR